MSNEFDRSICFTYFGNYYKQVAEIEKLFGIETAYKVERAIVEYGLFQKEIEDPSIRIYVGATALDLIDSSQRRRANGFGEDKEKTKAVEQYYQQHPDATQDEIVKATGVSKGKVNKVLKALKANAPVSVPSSASAPSFVTDNDSMTVTGDRSTECHTENAALKDADASTPTHTALQVFEEAKDHNRISSMTEYQRAVLECEDRIKKYEKEMQIYKESIEIIDLFRQRKKPREISEQTYYALPFVNMIIDEYRDRNDKKPEEPRNPGRILEIPVQNGTIRPMNLNELQIDPDDVAYIYKEFTDPEGDYKFQPEFTAEWFKDQFGYET